MSAQLITSGDHAALLAQPRWPELAQALIGHAEQRRWFRSKARRRAKVSIADVIGIADGLAIALLAIDYVEGAPETYVIFLAPEGHADPDQAFATALMQAMTAGARAQGVRGTLTGSALAALREIPPGTPLPAKVSAAEQTNSSIIYGGKLMLKIFRAIEEGTSLEYEIGRFLSTREPPYRGVPRLAGALEYIVPGHAPTTFGTLFEFVPNQGDAWKFTLDSLARSFDPAPYVPAVRLLGERTAEMHLALASDAHDPAFAPEPFDLAHQKELQGSVAALARRTFELLRGKLPALAPELRAVGDHVLANAAVIDRTLGELAQRPLAALRTRTHGDYHLGQVLWTGSDFLIIDFEGEPSRPLSERRAKRSPLRDVAGMLRSLDYASAAALRAQPAAAPASARTWTEQASAAYLAGYDSRLAGTAIAVADRELLLRVFLLEKVIYEIDYELNNRPDWVEIPLRGLAALLPS
jgi:maltose alpha-D-glucosyltransferase/alpha-amylase